MTYFAKLGLNSKVLDVVILDDMASEIASIEYLFSATGYPFWVQYSNDNSFRKNPARNGFTYDESLDAFIPPRPFPSWTLNEETCQWDSPTPCPGVDNEDWMWDEDNTSWTQLENIPIGD